MNPLLTDPQPLACDLTAIPASEREEHIITGPQLFHTAQEVQELSNGYAIRFLNEPGKFLAMAEFVENERLCCPFFRFRLEVEPNGGALWLRLTGGEGVKEILKATMLESHEGDALKKLIHTGGDVRLDEAVVRAALPILDGSLLTMPFPEE